MDEARDGFVGVDWASETHRGRLADARGRKVGEQALLHSAAGRAGTAAWAPGADGGTA